MRWLRWLRRIVMAVLVVLLAGAGATAYLYLAIKHPYRGYSSPEVYVDIPHGVSRRTIARLLAEQGVVRSRVAFELICRRRSRQTLQAGEYHFDHPMTALEVFDTVAQGRVYFHTITVPEGLTVFDIAVLVEHAGLASRDDFLRAVDPSPILDLAPRAPSVEGFLFPATYQFPRRVPPAEIIAAMVKRFREVWASFPEPGRNPHGLSVEQIVTLASLVEREASRPEERPIIAGVFYNRLRRHIPLECDPTVVYALELANRYADLLDPADLHFNSPYNTYLHIGLPPGPIANPGEASLRAALYPARVDYLYFVADGQGGHLFSRTFAEHKRNVDRYRRALNHEAADEPPVEQSAPARVARRGRPRSQP